MLTPEERVRQALVWFVIEGAKLAGNWRGQFRLEVEQRSLDVAAFVAGEMIDEKFSPRVPVFIVETKRIEHDALDDPAVDEQIRQYMKRERCRSGLIFNGRAAGWLSLDKEPPHPGVEQLNDLCDVEERIAKATTEGVAHVRECKRSFIAASSGDFDSFRRLVSLFGTDAGLTFSLSVRFGGSLARVQAFNLRGLGDDAVMYRARGVASRNAKQLLRANFHSLLSIQQL